MPGTTRHELTREAVGGDQVTLHVLPWNAILRTPDDVIGATRGAEQVDVLLNVSTPPAKLAWLRE